MRRTPSVGAVLAAALEARAHAAQGDGPETRLALGRAEAILAALEPGSVIASAFGYTESQFRFHEGNAYTRLRDIRPALRAQERALELCPPGDYTDWAMTRLDRASCLAQAGDTPGAVAYATETLTGLSGEQRQASLPAADASWCALCR
jgi:tetratricopeptide (TPR) repeat protein